MTWSDPMYKTKSGQHLKWLLLSVRRVRNNLFHGGKFPLMPIHEPSRDHNLIKNALIILSAALDLDPEVKRNFLDGLE